MSISQEWAVGHLLACHCPAYQSPSPQEILGPLPFPPTLNRWLSGTVMQVLRTSPTKRLCSWRYLPRVWSQSEKKMSCVVCQSIYYFLFASNSSSCYFHSLVWLLWPECWSLWTHFGSGPEPPPRHLPCQRPPWEVVIWRCTWKHVVVWPLSHSVSSIPKFTLHLLI